MFSTNANWKTYCVLFNSYISEWAVAIFIYKTIFSIRRKRTGSDSVLIRKSLCQQNIQHTIDIRPFLVHTFPCTDIFLVQTFSLYRPFPCADLSLYRSFLMRFTLTNKAVGTIWRALSKPPQMRQGPDLRPLWLLVGTPSVISPESASRRAEHRLSYSDVTIYIYFDIQYLSPMLYVYRFLLPLRLGWLLVCCLYKEVYLQFFKCVSFWLHGRCGKWDGWASKPVNHTSWVAVVTPTDRPKSMRNRYVIELFCGVVCSITLPFWHFC